MTEDECAINCRRVRGVWNSFIQSTGLHGINKIAVYQDATKFRILYWALLILGASSCLIYTVIQELRNYKRHPTTMTSFPVNHDSMIFPSITVCNLNSLNRSAIKDDPRNHVFYLKISNMLNRVSYTGFSIPDPNWTDPFYEDKRFFDNLTKEDILKENKNILESMVSKVMFDNNPLDIKAFFTTRISPLGPCLTSKPDMAVRTMQSGPYLNYEITLNLDTSENYYGNYPGDGVQLMVHDPNVDPEFDTNVGKYFLQPGADVYAEVSKREFQYLGYPYESMPGKYCRSKKADGSDYYQGLCLRDCVASLLYKICGCITFSHNNEVYCSKYKRLTCATALIGSINKDLIPEKKCDCPIPCSYSRYHVTVTSVPAPSTFYAKDFFRLFKNRTLKQFKEDIIVVHIYFNELSTNIAHQLPQYSGLGDIFAKLGGQMGLFLGASIITLIEIVEMVVYLVCLCFKRKQQVAIVQETD